ncbi:MAG: ParB N-terminal domain-containing protein [Patescibacteria group bacterium]
MQTREIGLETLELKYEGLRSRRPAQEKKLLACLDEAGQQSPIIVVRSAVAGRYIVIDGHKRVRALKRLKMDVANASAWEMDDAEALVRTYQMDSQGRRDAFEEGWLVAQLHRVWKWNLGEVAKRLLRSKSWVSKRLALVEELPEWMAEEVLSGRIGAHAAANFLAPLTRGNAEEGKLLAERIRGLGLTNRQIGELYACYRTSGALVRRKIVEDPALFLRAKAAARHGDAQLGEKESWCVKNLELVGNVSLSLARGLPEALGCDVALQARERLLGAWRRCHEHFTVLVKTAEALARQAGHD